MELRQEKYTLQLARRGHRITAVDISAVLLEGSRNNIVTEGLEKLVEFVVADERDLSEVLNKDFDAVLLKVPLYHLIDESDRKAAMKDAFDRL